LAIAAVPLAYKTWISPRLRILDTGASGNWCSTLVRGLTIIVFGIVIVQSEVMLDNIRHSVTAAGSADLRVDRLTATVHFTADYHLDGDRIYTGFDLTADGRHNEYVDVTAYLMLPFFDQPAQGPVYWFGLEKERQLPADPPQTEIRSTAAALEASLRRQLWHYDVDSITHFRVVTAGHQRDVFRQLVLDYSPTTTRPATILMPRTGKDSHVPLAEASSPRVPLLIFATS